ncbi:MAG TPA: type II secretion system protein [Tepidisphaeraceae bacterium]|jgi:prepilin-type N-terminal cleavage/methylation domain-containing protein|nr:type II secretion system protein [Tepidisphaeraceae bacterium]
MHPRPNPILASPRPRVPASSSSRRGFTLIEILCVVVIIGLTSAIILPQMGSRDDQRVASASRMLMADLLYAQNRSIAYQTRHYVQFNTVTNSYQVMVDSGSNTPGSVITHPVNSVSYVQTVGTGSLAKVSMQSVSFDSNTTIAFDTMGVPYSYNATTGLAPLTSGSVVFQAGINKLTVSVAPYSGEITVH